MTSVIARRFFVTSVGASIFGATAYFSYQLSAINSSQPSANDSTSSACSDCCSARISSISDPNRNLTFQKIAKVYDEEISKEETLMGLQLMRRALLYFHSNGKVLEVAGGTGRNLSYYPNNVESVVVTDLSDRMLMQGRQKVRNFGDEKDRKRFQFFVADAVNISKYYENNTFDTVVDTFGLCSFDDPVAVLKELQRVCKPDGKILLLEHGRSKTWQSLSNYLDKTAERHAENWGSVYNRDLDQILADSELEIKTLHTYHFGTTYYVVCKPNLKVKSETQEDDKIDDKRPANVKKIRRIRSWFVG